MIDLLNIIIKTKRIDWFAIKYLLSFNYKLIKVFKNKVNRIKLQLLVEGITDS